MFEVKPIIITRSKNKYFSFVEIYGQVSSVDKNQIWACFGPQWSIYNTVKG